MGLLAAAIYIFVWHMNCFFLVVFVLGSIAIEIRMLNAVKKVHILSPCAITAFGNSGAIFFTKVLNKWWAKQVIQALLEYQVPDFKMTILLN